MNILKLFLLTFLTILLFQSCICEKEKCKNCVNQASNYEYLEKDEDPTLKISCTTKMFQPLHLDLVNGLGVYGKPILINDSLVDFNFRLKEVKGCSRYDIVSAKWLLKCKRKGIYINHIELTINKSEDISRNEDIHISKPFNFNVGEGIDIHIKSDDPNIASDTSPNDCSDTIDKPLFGSGVCFSKIIN